MFLDNLLRLPTEQLATLAATLAEANARTLVQLQVRAWAQRSPRHPDGPHSSRQSADALLQERMAATRDRLRRQDLPDESLRWMIRQQLAVRAGERQVTGVIEDQRLAFAVLRYIAPLYHIPVRPTASLDWLEEEIFRHFLREMGQKAEDELRAIENDSQKANDLEQEIGRRLQALSRGEREALQRDLGLTHLSGRELRLFVARGGLTTASLVGAASTGMGVYLATTTVTHAVATTLLGITLPFAAYSTLMSTLALFLSPIGALVLVGGSGLVQWQRLRREVNRRVLLYAVVTLVQGDTLLVGS